jgi:hypothetical protein
LLTPVPQTELQKAGVWEQLQLGDVVWNAAVKDAQLNAGKSNND